MIIEGLVTSIDSTNTINVAPMGPIVHGDFESLTLRPFAGSTTFENLVSTKAGVFHVVDRVHLIAEAAIRKLTTTPPMFPAKVISGAVLSDCCRCFEFRITSIDDSDSRAILNAEIVHSENVRPFLGFNRARHAVIEAAILATRVHLLPYETIQRQLPYLESAVEKTGGQEERDAFQMLSDFIHQHADGMKLT